MDSEHSTLQGGKWERGASHRRKAGGEDQRGHSNAQGAALEDGAGMRILGENLDSLRCNKEEVGWERWGWGALWRRHKMNVWSLRVVLQVTGQHVVILENSSSRPGFILSEMKYRSLSTTLLPHLSWCPLED